MVVLHIIKDWRLPKTEQIAKAIRIAIENGLYRKNDQLPSINEFSVQYKVARDTVEKAYRILKQSGYVVSLSGKGFFVTGKKNKQLKVLLVLNKLSTYKKSVYNSFINALGKKVKVDLHIHHYDIQVLKEILESNVGQYDYYAVMPHFYHNTRQNDILDLLSSIPQDKLVLLDKSIKGLKSIGIQVYQDFERDIYQALVSANDNVLVKYSKIVVLLHRQGHHPREIVTGIRKYCRQFDKKLEMLNEASEVMLEKGTLYIETSESDLAALVKKIRKEKLKMGRDIGILSFNETVLKELLHITVATTDFEAMGTAAAQSILKGKPIQIKNPFYLIKRKSV